MKKINVEIGQKFSIAAAVLMTRAFSTPLPTNRRRCAFAAGPATTGSLVAPPSPDTKFDVVGLGFIPGREWKGPVEVFVEEVREVDAKRWDGCSFWADSFEGPLYLLTSNPEVGFSFDGWSLVPLIGDVSDRAAGIARASKRLKEAALRLPWDEVERQSMM